MALILSPEHYDLLRKDLDSFLDNSEADTVLLIDRGGNIIVDSGEAIEDRIDTISALTAGAFAATQALAAVLEEEEFTVIYHQGKKTRIFICSVSEDALLLALFSKSTTVGLVKMYVQNTCRNLSSLMTAIGDSPETKAIDPTQSFQVNKDPFFEGE